MSEYTIADILNFDYSDFEGDEVFTRQEYEEMRRLLVEVEKKDAHTTAEIAEMEAKLNDYEAHIEAAGGILGSVNRLAKEIHALKALIEAQNNDMPLNGV